MDSDPSKLQGAAIASLAAAPIFVTSFGLATLYLQAAEPIVIGASDILSFLMFLTPSTMVGFVLALVPNLLGSMLMLAAAERSEFARMPEVWAIAGAGMGAGIAVLFGLHLFDQTSAFALCATSAACALICNRHELRRRAA